MSRRGHVHSEPEQPAVDNERPAADLVDDEALAGELVGRYRTPGGDDAYRAGTRPGTPRLQPTPDRRPVAGDARGTKRGGSAGASMSSPRPATWGRQVRHAQRGFDERVQTACLQRCIQLAQQPAHQAEVHGADDIGVLLGGFAERAVLIWVPR